MIGVAAKAADLDVVAEFFELFKIPWQVASADRRYDVVLVADDDRDLDDVSASALVIYGSNARSTRGAAAPVVDRVRGPITIRWDGSEWPVYGNLAIFANGDDPAAATSDKGRVESSERQGARTICRIGYDLFSEVRRLLTAGQPAGNAATPTLELHIALLRDRLERLGASLVEVPARPDGYDFVCCLTHDVDFCGITRHRADSTIAGFIWRASVWTSVELLRGRRTLGEACRNWSALAALPLTLAGLARDFWDPFESYAEADRGHASTFS